MTKTKLTPAMRQYMDAKQELSEDTILLFRMGDFYELFFEDAQRGAPLMDIVLTKRGGVPMCGIPYHAMKGYISKLLEAGVKVAIAEQVEDPKTAKGLVKRAVVQVITPGTVMDDSVLNSSKSNFLVAIVPFKKGFGIASLDISTGDFRATQVDDVANLETEIQRLHPSECVIPTSLQDKWRKEDTPDVPSSIVWSPLEDWLFDFDVANDRLCRHFEIASLDGFGCRGKNAIISAAGAVFYYAQNNLRRDAAHVTGLRTYQTNSCMILDRISQRNLELVEPIFADSKDSTLLNVLDKTITPMGGRLIREWILRPLCEVDKINQRLESITQLVRDPLLLNELREALEGVRDLERTIVRVNVGSANGRDLLVLQKGLERIPGLKSILSHVDADMIREIDNNLIEQPEVTNLIERAILEEPPITIKDGGIIKDGYNDNLDDYRKAATDGKSWLAGFQEKEIERTGIKSLKIRYNKVFGYYIEVTKSNLDLIPDNYTRKQTLVNAERFITPELKEIEDKVLGAEEKSKNLEYEIFQQVRSEVVTKTSQIQEIARSIAVLDVLGSLAEVASRNEYCCPTIVAEPVLSIKDGRHPVVDIMLQDERFVPNDTELNTVDNQVALITGPNMAGKSTYIRQVALLTLMAQMGSYIPASEATVGIVDRIFTRVGAADDISRGQSTFMVEMVETANILNNATASSLIILDEIGRGTSTFDGLSLAWSVAEYLHDHKAAKARTLFATHYHELTELSMVKKGVQNYNIAVKEYGDKIIFLRKIMPGGTDKSYGIHVARLAGLPKMVINRAREVLTNLESKELSQFGMPKIAKRRGPKNKEVDEGQQPMLFDL